VSPWNTVYDGGGVTGRIKTYLIPKSIFEIGVGHWRKEFFDTMESIYDEFLHARILTTLGAEEREDRRTRLYGSIQRPFMTKSGLFLEPSLRLEHIKNSSSIDVYDYSFWTAKAGIKLVF
jgi:hypothetical protein